jgi:hypothetical protein
MANPPSAPRRTIVVAAAAAAAITLLVAAVVGIPRLIDDSSSAAPTTTATSAEVPAAPGAPRQPPTTAAPPDGLKEPIVGLLDRQGEPKAGYELSGWVVKSSWADLQPTAGGPIAEQNEIDDAIVRARELGMVLKLRVYTGTEAPEWAKQLGGPPVPLVDPADGQTITIGRFWTEPFGRAYADFQGLLAARYDDVAEIRETVISRCTTVFAEPFIRQTAAAENLTTYAAAGLNDETDLRCFKEQVDAHDVWKQTRSDLAVSPYQSVQAKAAARDEGRAQRGGDLAIPEQVMRYCRERLGPRCVLENNSLRIEPRAQYEQLYEVMQGLGRPLAFQTATGDKVGNLADTISRAADLGAASVELPISYRKAPASDLGSGVGRLSSN